MPLVQTGLDFATQGLGLPDVGDPCAPASEEHSVGLLDEIWIVTYAQVGVEHRDDLLQGLRRGYRCRV